MLTAKVFENGRSQAVRIPKEYRFKEEEVSVNKIGQVLLLFPKQDAWSSFARALDMFTEDFMSDRRDDKNQERIDL